MQCEACRRRGYEFCHRPKWHDDPASGLNQIEDALGATLQRVIALTKALQERIDLCPCEVSKWPEECDRCRSDRALLGGAIAS
jgi:hypothetical protein